MKQKLEATKIYMEKNQTNYWDDFVKTEEAGEKRFLGRIGRFSWFTAFAPMGVAGDVLAVVDGVRSTLGFTDDNLSDLSNGLVRAMAAYDKMGFTALT